MSGSLNKVTLIGNVGNDPEIRSTSDGREIASLSIATSESWKDKNTGERKTKTEWHRVSCFSPGLVNLIKNYIKKGSKLYVEGSLQTRKWQDQNNQDRYTTEVVLQGYNCNITMLDSRNGGDNNGGGYDNNSGGGGYSNNQQPNNQNNNNNTNFASNGDDFDDDIPF